MILDELSSIDWFANVGQSSQSSIQAWNEWPKPEDPGCEYIALDGQKHHDELVRKSNVDEYEFQQFIKLVLNEISKKISFDMESDSYDPKSEAAWEGAWTGKQARIRWDRVDHRHDRLGIGMGYRFGGGAFVGKRRRRIGHAGPQSAHYIFILRHRSGADYFLYLSAI